MAVHTFLKSAFTSLVGNVVDMKVLRRDIEANGIIVVALMDGLNALRWADEVPDPLYSFAFVSTLPGPQLTELGVIVAAHTGPDTTAIGVTRTFLRTVDPLVTDDETSIEAFRVGDEWVNTVEQTTLTLVDATAGAAVWEWNTFAGDFRETDVAAAIELLNPSAHPGDQLLATVPGGGAAIIDGENIIATVATTNYTPATQSIEDHLLAIDAQLGVVGSAKAFAYARQNALEDAAFYTSRTRFIGASTLHASSEFSGGTSGCQVTYTGAATKNFLAIVSGTQSRTGGSDDFYTLQISVNNTTVIRERRHLARQLYKPTGATGILPSVEQNDTVEIHIDDVPSADIRFTDLSLTLVEI